MLSSRVVLPLKYGPTRATHRGPDSFFLVMIFADPLIVETH
jgi:hypothetical protein